MAERGERRSRDEPSRRDIHIHKAQNTRERDGMEEGEVASGGYVVLVNDVCPTLSCSLSRLSQLRLSDKWTS
jgi:hypothetical protein